MGRGLNGFGVWSIILAIVGAVILLWIYRLAVRRPT
jgi:Transglycosylase associated protein.